MEKTKKLQILAIILTVCLVASLSFNVYQFLNGNGENSETSMTRTFTRQYKSYIREDGIVQINATFDWSGSNLTMTIKVNDDDFKGWDYIGLVFDKDGDEDLHDEVAYMLYAGNRTAPWWMGNRLKDWGGIYEIPIGGYLPSPYHICTFKEDEGYTFNIEIPKVDINFRTLMLTHILFFDRDAWHSSRQQLPYGTSEQIALNSNVWFEFEVYGP